MEYNASVKLAFKPLPDYFMSYIGKYAMNLKFAIVPNKTTISILFDENSASEIETKMLSEDGWFTPGYVYFWSNLLYKIRSYNNEKGYSSCWINEQQKHVYGNDLSSFLEIINHTFLWENNECKLYFVWGKITDKKVLKTKNECSGILIPTYDGLGFILHLDIKEYDVLMALLFG